MCYRKRFKKKTRTKAVELKKNVLRYYVCHYCYLHIAYRDTSQLILQYIVCEFLIPEEVTNICHFLLHLTAEYHGLQY